VCVEVTGACDTTRIIMIYVENQAPAFEERDHFARDDIEPGHGRKESGKGEDEVVRREILRRGGEEEESGEGRADDD
jgi:hypothetical protein